MQIALVEVYLIFACDSSELWQEGNLFDAKLGEHTAEPGLPRRFLETELIRMGETGCHSFHIFQADFLQGGHSKNHKFGTVRFYSFLELCENTSGEVPSPSILCRFYTVVHTKES